MVNNADTSQDTTIYSNIGGTMAASPSQFDFVVLEEVLESVAGGVAGIGGW